MEKATYDEVFVATSYLNDLVLTQYKMLLDSFLLTRKLPSRAKSISLLSLSKQITHFNVGDNERLKTQCFRAVNGNVKLKLQFLL